MYLYNNVLNLHDDQEERDFVWKAKTLYLQLLLHGVHEGASLSLFGSQVRNEDSTPCRWLGDSESTQLVHDVRELADLGRF